MRQKRIHKAGICASFFICKLFENSSKKDVFQVLPSPNFCQQLEKIPLPKIGKGMVRVRSIFSTILCVLKNGNKKTRSLDKIPKLRAFLPFQLLLIIGLLETHVTNDTMHTQKAKGVRSAPHTPQIFCTNSVPSFKTNTIFPSRYTTAFSTAASHNCVSNSGSIPFCPVNIL